MHCTSSLFSLDSVWIPFLPVFHILPLKYDIFVEIHPDYTTRNIQFLSLRSFSFKREVLWELFSSLIYLKSLMGHEVTSKITCSVNECMSLPGLDKKEQRVRSEIRR